jgi:hypothetical protein
LSYWRGKDVVLKLSPEGKQALSDAYDTEFVKVFVQWADDFGLWVVQDRQETGEISVMLIKWPFFDTALLDVIWPEPITGKIVGFHKQG